MAADSVRRRCWEGGEPPFVEDELEVQVEDEMVREAVWRDEWEEEPNRRKVKRLKRRGIHAGFRHAMWKVTIFVETYPATVIRVGVANHCRFRFKSETKVRKSLLTVLLHYPFLSLHVD